MEESLLSPAVTVGSRVLSPAVTMGSGVLSLAVTVRGYDVTNCQKASASISDHLEGDMQRKKKKIPNIVKV